MPLRSAPFQRRKGLTSRSAGVVRSSSRLLVGVLFESAALATMIAVALMIMSAILAQTSFMFKLLSSEWSRNVWRTLYYTFPKIYDLGRITNDAIADRTFSGAMPIWSSAVFGAVVLASALVIFARRDF